MFQSVSETNEKILADAPKFDCDTLIADATTTRAASNSQFLELDYFAHDTEKREKM